MEVKLSLYADDMTAFLRDKDSAEALIRVDDFREASGLALNMGKSNVMWLGAAKERKDPIGEIKACKTVKTLGIYFSASETCDLKNVDPICRKIEGVIKMWNQRTLTLKGRITVCRSLMASQLVYLCSCVKIPKKNIAALQSKIMRFLWRGRPPKVALRILRQKIEHGGLNAIDLALFCKSLKLAWVRRIHMCKESLWRRLLQARIGKYELDDMLQTCLGSDDIRRFNIPVFYKELLTEFQTYSLRPTDSIVNIQEESLWFNRSIRVGGKTVFNNCMYQAGIKMINDLTREDGSIMSLSELKIITPGIKVDVLTYQLIIRGIPKMWKDKLAAGRYNKVTEHRNQLHTFSIGNKTLNIGEMRSCHFYRAQIGQETPTAVARWEHYGKKVDDWEKVFRLPYSCTKATKLQTLQYRVLNRYLPTQRYLFIRNVVETPICRQCNQTDTIEHFLFSCNEVKPLWNTLFKKIYKTQFNTVHNVIFGVINSKPAINLLILLGKQYIVQCKLAASALTPTVHGLMLFINYHVNIEKRIAISNNHIHIFRKKWSNVLNANDVFIWR